MDEELIFILDWGEACARLLYARVVEGEVVEIDGVVRASEAIVGGVPRDEELAAQTLMELAEHFKVHHELVLQTLFVLVKTGAQLAYRVNDARIYLDYLDRERGGTTPFSPPGHEIPHHCDLFDAFESETDAFRYAFALPSSMREAIQHSLLKANCFVEGFVSLPRIGVKSRQRIQPGLILGVFQESSIVMAANGDDLPFYQEFPFSLNMVVEKIRKRFSIPKDRADRLLQWVIRPPNSEEFNSGHPEDQQLYFSPNFKQLTNDIADELDRLAVAIRQNMEDCGAWDLGFDHVYLLGEGRPFYHHFTFLRDTLPLEPLELPIPYAEALSETAREPEFAPLVRLIDHCLHLRGLHRKAQQAGSPLDRMKSWGRRLVGR